MQIHELNPFQGELGSEAFLVVDNGEDTGKISVERLTEPINERIDDIITSPAPTEQEIIDARRGWNEVYYATLGGAIRSQVKQILAQFYKFNTYDLLGVYGTPISRTRNGVTFTWDEAGQVCEVSGEAVGGDAYASIYTQTGAWQGIFERGVTYTIGYETTDPNVKLRIAVWEGVETTPDYYYFDENGHFGIPPEAAKISIDLWVASGDTVSAVVKNVYMLRTYTAKEVTATIRDAMIGADRHMYNSLGDAIREQLNGKVDKVTGKVLSSNDFTDAEKTKLSGIEAGSEVNAIEAIKLDGTELTPDANRAVDIPVDETLTAEGVPAEAKATGDAIADLRGELYDKTEVELPYTVGGEQYLEAEVDSYVVTGTRNKGMLYPLWQGETTINGVTFTINGNHITVIGTATAQIQFSLMSGRSKSGAELAAETYELPDRDWYFTNALADGFSSAPAISVRKKDNSGAISPAIQANILQYDKDVWGGLYIYVNSGQVMNRSSYFGIFPENSRTYEKETSERVQWLTGSAKFNAHNGDYIIGDSSSTLYSITKKATGKKPCCLYSTRTIDYSSMIECLDIYVPAKVGYVNYIFGHTQNTAPASEGGGDVWRLVQIDSVDDAFSRRFHITTLGETEMAIKIKGRDDFIGGTTHGDEVMDEDSFLVLLDGSAVDVTTLTSLTEFTTLQAFLVSDMYDPDDHSTNVGVHGRSWTFTSEGLLLEQTVDFLEDLTLHGSYMPMLCVVRGNDTISAEQITDTYLDDGNFAQYDVSVGGFTTYPNQLKPDVRKLHLVGKTSGVEATLEIIEQPIYNRHGSYIFNGVNTYNKIYCCLCSYGNGSFEQAVSSGDKWTVKSRIRINVG